MSRLRSSLAALAFALSSTLAACGGGPSGPVPLKRHFEDTYLARLAVDQQAGVIEAEGAHAVAKREQAKADADLREAADLVKIARNEAAAAKLDVSSAKTRLTAARDSADRDRIGAAEKEQAAAEQAHGAADERVKYYTTYRDWLAKLLRYTQENTYWREAQYELAKAKLAAANNIAPPGFSLDDYATQESDRARRAADARSRADEARSKASAARDRWRALQTAADKTLGKESQFPDPMGKGVVESGGDPSLGAGGATIGGSPAPSDEALPQPQDSTGGGGGP